MQVYVMLTVDLNRGVREGLHKSAPDVPGEQTR